MKINKRLIGILVSMVVLLTIPAITMQFSDEVNWSTSDFALMAVLLLGVGLLIELIARKMKKRGLKILLIAAIVILFLLAWAELAVGIFGTPLAGD